MGASAYRIAGVLFFASLSLSQTCLAQNDKPPAQPPLKGFADPFGGPNPLGNDPFADPLGKPDVKKADKPKTGDGKPAEPQQTIDQKIDQLEKEFEEQRRLADYGKEEILTFSNELTDEYLQNKEALQNGEVDKQGKAKLERRQKIISLYLWELQRVGPKLVEADLRKNSVHAKATKLMNENRAGLMRNGKARDRLYNFVRRVMQESHRSTVRRHNRGFYFVEPQGKSESQPKPKLNAPPPAAGVVASGIHEPLSSLLKVDYQDGRLVLDRAHWDRRFANKSLQEVSKEVQDLLKKRGLTEGVEKVNGHPLNRLQINPSAVLLFENLHHAAQRYGISGGSSSGSSGNSVRKSFHCAGIDASLNWSNGSFDFKLEGGIGSDSVLRVISDQAVPLKITSIAGENVFVFSQKKDGSMRLVDVTEEETISHTADSFAQFYAQHPAFVEDRLFPQLAKLGFSLAPTRLHADVVSRVVASIKETSPETHSRFGELMSQLDSSAFSARDRATREIESNLENYLPLLLKAIGNDTLPLDARTRLSRVIKQYKNQWSEIDTLVTKMDAANDVAYLISLLSVTTDPQAQIIAKRLAQKTSQDFGADIEAWKNWLGKQQ